MSSLGYILVGLGGIGVIGEGIYSATTAKLNSTDWGLKIFIPTFISLLLIILGMYMIFKNDLVNGINSEMFYPLIVFMASGSIAFSSIIIVFSEHIVNWKSN
jgi:sulfite exporter TauE/SafE